MTSWRLFPPAATRRHHEEDWVALAPPEPPRKHLPAPACGEEEDDGAASYKARVLVPTTRSAVGLFLAGLALLALAGTATGWWIQLDSAVRNTTSDRFHGR